MGNKLYDCEICGHQHRYTSKIGKEHLPKIEEKTEDKPLRKRQRINVKPHRINRCPICFFKENKSYESRNIKFKKVLDYPKKRDKRIAKVRTCPKCGSNKLYIRLRR